jgi:hypothetical protein
MIRPAAIIDSTFQPYARTNAELTVAEEEDRAALIEQVDSGAKNHLDLHAIAKTESNVTFVINSDKTISVTTNGAASAQVSTKLLGNIGNYVPNIYGGLLISGVPNPDKGTALYVAYSNNGTSQVASTTLRAGETTIIDDTYPYIQIFILVYSGSNIGSTPVVFKPMICTTADYVVSPKFVPYAKTNRELTVAEDEDRAALIEQVDNGAKNKLHYDGISTPSGDTANISFSCSGDSITITGSASSNAAWCYLTLAGSIITVNDFCNGKYYLSSERTGSGAADIFAYESSVGQFADDSGNGTVIPNKSTSNAVRIMVNIPKGATVNITLKIMICTAADYAVSPKFVPYRPSWQEMWEMIQALQNNS